MSDDVTVKLLADIRDELRSGLGAVRTEIGELRQEVRTEIGGLREELHVGLADVRREMLASEMRHATRVTEQTAATRNLYELLQDRFDLRDRVERCEHDIAELKQRR